LLSWLLAAVVMVALVLLVMRLVMVLVYTLVEMAAAAADWLIQMGALLLPVVLFLCE
jgi:hypothetical protein